MGRRMRRQSFASSTCVLIVVASSSLGQAFVFSSRLSPIKNFFRTPRCDGSTRANQKRAASPDEDLDGARDPAPLREMEAPPVLSVPVFSLATLNEDGSRNMNVVTYASPTGIQPERLWMVSLYKSTLSHENFFREGWGILQFLRPVHAMLIPVLGKSSGRDTDKAAESTALKFPWERPPRELLAAPQSIAVVPGCIAHVALGIVSKQPAGDHDSVVCRVLGVAGSDEWQGSPDGHGVDMLYTRHLLELGII